KKSQELQAEITRHRQAGEALRQAQEGLELRIQERTAEFSRSNEALAAADVRKDEFVAMLAHELHRSRRQSRAVRREGDLLEPSRLGLERGAKLAALRLPQPPLRGDDRSAPLALADA